MSIDYSLLNQVAIVLVRPKFPKNIGAAARVACNMGLTRLIVIADERPPREPMALMATHKALPLIDNLEVYPNLAEALAPFATVIGTTARRGRHRLLESTPRDIVQKVLPSLKTNQVAILFGPEDAGLSNDDLKFCQLKSAIPSAEFSSLNLAQAVAIHCYELYYGVIHEQKDMEFIPEKATTFDLESMYEHMEDALTEVDFLTETNNGYWMRNIRQFFARLHLSPKDASLVRGICKKFIHFQTQRNK